MFISDALNCCVNNQIVLIFFQKRFQDLNWWYVMWACNIMSAFTKLSFGVVITVQIFIICVWIFYHRKNTFNFQQSFSKYDTVNIGIIISLYILPCYHNLLYYYNNLYIRPRNTGEIGNIQLTYFTCYSENIWNRWGQIGASELTTK